MIDPRRIMRACGKAGWPGVILTAMASPMDIDDAGDASVWINGDTSSAQDWQVPEDQNSLRV